MSAKSAAGGGDAALDEERASKRHAPDTATGAEDAAAKTATAVPFEELSPADMATRLEEAATGLESAAAEIQERVELYVQLRCATSIDRYTDNMATIVDRITAKTAMFRTVLSLVQVDE